MLKGGATDNGSSGDFPERIDLREAAQRLGVHYMTAYRYVRLGRLPATQQGGRWWIDPADLAELRAPHPDHGRRRRPSPSTYQPRLRARMLAGDELGAWAVLETAIVAGASPQTVLLDILAPILREIGQGWERGELSVGDEHRVSAVAVRLFGRLSPRFVRRGRSRGTVVVAGVAGDHHSLPPAMLAAVLRGAGWTVVELGADTPADQVVAAVAAVPGGPRAVGLSVSADRYKRAARKTMRVLRAAFPSTTLLAGGPALKSEEEARAVGADGWDGDAAGVVDLLAGLGSTNAG